ncbi:phage tail protein [Chromobacterium sp. IIBBL 290-4]|uniref:phage tail protein n=1 Tax=Chromobacterium sp. IIBBL 290-4 TaxID=2953890 RepID=UPI0020B6957B|nr:phage tail protein [Chromobacterium sp. IIBBL 290-4]UTH76089.1 phage tail protein [Chromobacterium sp. IIBBL 290-4]
MYAVLGDIEFDLISYFDGLEQRGGSDYAEHGRIGGKPVLQFVGDRLDEIRIDLVLHAAYCDPDGELQRLHAARQQHQALALVLGNGDHKGHFVITELTSTGRQTDRSGNLIAVEAQLSLREFGGQPAAGARPGLLGTISGLAQAKVNQLAPGAGLRPNLSGLTQAVSQAKNLADKVRTVVNDVRELKDQAGRDPLSAFARVPKLINDAQVAAPGLAQCANRLNDFIQPYAHLAETIQPLVQPMRDTGAKLVSLGKSLGGCTQDNVADKLKEAAGALQDIDKDWQSRDRQMALLAAQTAVRRILE